MKQFSLRGVGRKALAFAMAAACAIGMSAAPLTAMAAPIIDGEQLTGTITIVKNTEEAGEVLGDADFALYKVIDISFDDETGYAVYTVVDEYGEVLEGITIDALENMSASEVEELAHDLAAVAAELDEGVSGSAADYGPLTTDEDGEAVFEDVALGWYLVIETKAPEGYIATAPFLVAMPSAENYDSDGQAEDWIYDITVSPKDEPITIEKELIYNGSDPDGDEGADGTVGYDDYVQYQLTATIPTYPAYYSDVVLTVEDFLSDGLSIIENDTNDYEEHYIIITAGDDIYECDEGGWEIWSDEGFFDITIVAESSSDAANLTVELHNDFIREHEGEELVITYWVKVSEYAIAGTDGNDNMAVLTYSNGPAHEDTATVDSNEVYVYTFDVQVVKFTGESEDGEAVPLEGAEFMMYYDAELTDPVCDANGDPMTLVTDENGYLSVGDGFVRAGFVILDEGVYYIEETKSPAGYTLLSNPVKIEIIATRDEETEEPDGGFIMLINDVEADGEYEDGVYVSGIFVSEDDATAYVAIENHEGFSLPATGGIGIALFLIAGAAGITGVSVKSLKKKDEDK